MTSPTPIFSGGTGRSGTTIVGKLLSRHSEVKCGQPYEIKFMTQLFSLTELAYGMRSHDRDEISRNSRVYLKFRSLKSQKTRLKKFEDRMLGDWFKRSNRLGEESGLHRGISESQIKTLLNTLRENANQDLEGACRTFFFDFILTQRQYSGQANWMDTSPPNIANAAEIFRLLPSAKFIEMKRNPLDTVSSVLKENWGPNDFDTAVKWWLRRTESASRALEKIPERQKLSIKLEDLVVHQREATYMKLLDFLELDDEPAMRKYFNTKMPPEKMHENRWKAHFPNHEETERRFLELSQKS